MSVASLAGIIPVVVFLVVALGIAVYSRNRAARTAGSGFVGEYFLGNRSLGAFVLAMTTIATYGSVSSFVGGPGQAWATGFGWVYMAAVQVTTLFLLYGIMGKKMALVSRKLGAVTVIDVIRARYQSNALANAAAIIIVVFFATTMIAQFVGGAKLFEAVTGYSYVIGLVIFAVAVIAFTTLGGFRGVAITDALCGIAMLVSIVVLAGGIFTAGGGYEQVMDTIAANHPEMLEPLDAGGMPIGLYFTQWLLVGVFTFCLPQSVVRTMGFKDMKAMRNAMVLGTVIIGFMMIGVTALGTFSAGVLTDDLAAYGGSVDNIIPRVIVETLPPWLAGIAIVGPIAASISTVSSLLIAASSAIVKDVWLNYRHPKAHVQESLPSGSEVGKPDRARDDRVVRIVSHAMTLFIGVVVFVLSITPPDLIWKINMFAFGGLETAFCWVLVCGLFWKRATKTGAILSMVGGTAAYCIAMALGFKMFGLHQITIGIPVALILMVVGSLATKQADEKTLDVFFPERR